MSVTVNRLSQYRDETAVVSRILEKEYPDLYLEQFPKLETDKHVKVSEKFNDMLKQAQGFRNPEVLMSLSLSLAAAIGTTLEIFIFFNSDTSCL